MRFYLLLFVFTVSSWIVAAQNTGQIKGTVTNSLSNEPIGFATITVEGTSNGATTDEQGRYTITGLKPGFYNLRLRYIGFKPKTIFEVQVTPSKVAIVDIQLEEEKTKLKEVTVESSPFVRMPESPVSLQTLGVAEIQRNPGGNRDISKAIQSLPGVASGPGFRNDIIIRGGAPNENRFYLDGVEVPVINHFATQGSSGGPVGIINVDAIREVDFYSGAFPAARGNALSSVLEFKQKDARTDKAAFRAILSATDVSLLGEGPINDKVTYLFSARRSYLQFLFSALNLPFLPTFNGFQAKVKYKIDQKNELSFIGLGAIDEFRLNTGLNTSLDPNVNPDVKNADDSLAVQERRFILGFLPINTQWNYTNGLVYKHYQKNGYHTFVLSRNMLNNRAFKYLNNDEKLGLTLDYLSQESENKFRYEHNLRVNSWKFNYGLNMETVRFTSNTFRIDRKIGSPGETDTLRFATKVNVFRYGLFGQATRSFFNEKLTVSAGLRLDGNDYSESMRNPFNQFSPRLSASWNFANNFNLNASTGIFYQLPAFTSFGYRDASGQLVNQLNNLKYIQATHYVAGIEYFSKKSFKSTLEVFYKDYQNYPFLIREQIALANLGSDFGVIGNDAVTSTAAGRSYGIEYLAQQKLSRGFYGILAYTWVRSEFQNARGEFIPSAWDSRHLLSLTAGKIFPKGWEVGVRARYAGGLPTTPFDVATSSLRTFWDANGRALPDYTRLNSTRAGDFTQIDIRIDKKWAFKKWAFNVYVDVQNLLNAQVRQQDNITVVRDANSNPVVDPNDSSRYLTTTIPNSAGNRLPSIGIVIDF